MNNNNNKEIFVLYKEYLYFMVKKKHARTKRKRLYFVCEEFIPGEFPGKHINDDKHKKYNKHNQQQHASSPPE